MLGLLPPLAKRPLPLVRTQLVFSTSGGPKEGGCDSLARSLLRMSLACCLLVVRGTALPRRRFLAQPSQSRLPARPSPKTQDWGGSSRCIYHRRRLAQRTRSMPGATRSFARGPRVGERAPERKVLLLPLRRQQGARGAKWDLSTLRKTVEPWRYCVALAIAPHDW
ncbi:hypothetical protein B0J18DRAFT_265005 [Chaetomium sp. MPI-SDFR-AT-0129]|nr:hypothetical protein B0J18DRAFT_265005 [Chaetomium sp. MPI-SDFR-AT-0129]